MKTYKQKYNDLSNKFYKLEESYRKRCEEVHLMKQVIQNNHLFDPIEYKKILKKLSITIDALEAIKMMSFDIKLEETQKSVYNIATEVLHMVAETFL